MSLNKKITILSTFTEDKIIDEANKTIKTQKGGPSFYISNVFKGEKLVFDIIKTPNMKIEIKLKKDGEVGRVKTRLRIKKVNFGKIKSELLIISTILKELNLRGISKFKGKIFLDIQGYVRDGRNLGGKKLFRQGNEIISSIFCLKGNEEEISYLQKDFIKSLKNKILIVTKGKLGCEAFILGKKYFIKPRKVLKTKNTIGAGDTFFAYFIAYLYKDNDPIKSLRRATEETSKFLEKNL